jgi:AraC-like DNA-binding protein
VHFSSLETPMLAWDGPYCPFIHCVGNLTRAHSWDCPQRRLAHYLLVASINGEERITVEGVTHRVASGGSYLVKPGELADIGSPRGNTPVWIHFDLIFDTRRKDHPHAGAYESELGKRADLLQPSPLAIWGVDLPTLVPESLVDLFREGVPRLVTRWLDGQPLAVLEAEHQLAGLLLAWVAQAMRGPEPAGANTTEARVARAEAQAVRSLDAGFGVEEFAAAAGWSRTRFADIYHRLRGITPGDFLRRERLRLAESLLMRGDLPVARVGALVGYPDPTVFGRFFRAHHRMTPGAWQRKHGP